MSRSAILYLHWTRASRGLTFAVLRATATLLLVVPLWWILTYS